MLIKFFPLIPKNVLGQAAASTAATTPPPPKINPSPPASRGDPHPSPPYKRARKSRVKQFNKRPRREHFSEILLPPGARRGPVSELPLQPEACRGPVSELLLQPRARLDSVSEPLRQSGPQGGAISLPQNDCHLVSHHQQSPPRSARPDLFLEVGLEPPATTPASRTPSEGQPTDPALHREMPHSSPSTIVHPGLLLFVRKDLSSGMPGRSMPFPDVFRTGAYISSLSHPVRGIAADHYYS